MKTVMAFGTFDFLHAGHLHLLKEARAHGDTLTVVIARDATVEKVKGKAPIQNENERRDVVAALRLVDEAVLGSETDVYAVIQEKKPDTIVLGYDQDAFVEKLTEKIQDFGLAIDITRAEPYQTEYKSSQVKKALTINI